MEIPIIRIKRSEKRRPVLSGLHDCQWFRKENLEILKNLQLSITKYLFIAVLYKLFYVLMKLNSCVLYSEQNDMWASIFNFHPYFPMYKTIFRAIYEDRK